MELLLVSHKGVASGLKSTARMVVGDMVDSIKVIELTAEHGIDVFAKELEEYLTTWLTEGTIGLILSDLKGGTPFNRTEMILAQHHLKERAKVISGVNLPMVIDALFREVTEWTEQQIAEIVQVGRDGIDCMDLAISGDDGEDE